MAFAIGYVHPGKVHHAFMESVMATLLAAPEVVIIPKLAGPNLARFRNEVVERFMAITEPEMEGLLFVDTDIVFYPEQVKKITESPHPITSGLYYNPKPGGLDPIQAFPVFTMGHSKYRLGTDDDIENEPFKVAGVGMGFCYIRREVLAALWGETDQPGAKQGRELVGPLWPFAEELFRTGYDEEIALGEDTVFCRRAHQNGFDCWVDPFIEVGHIKEHML